MPDLLVKSGIPFFFKSVFIFMSKLKYFLLLLFFLFLVSCSDETEPIVQVNFPIDKGFELLSEYNFFEGDIALLEPNIEAGVYNYDLNVPLFSDYALKSRFLYVPQGSMISFDTAAVLDFPVGSILIKNFHFKNPDNTNRNIETRLLIKNQEGWQPEIYIWDEAQTDAQRSVIGDIKQLDVLAGNEQQQFNYLIPNQNQCKNCHDYQGAINPVGPMIQNLDHENTIGQTLVNQVDFFIQKGILEDDRANSPIPWETINDNPDELDKHARNYLHVNCATCHSPQGSASNSGFYLNFDNQDSLSLGIWKTPVSAGEGSGGFNYAIHPGQADKSILLFRMESDIIDVRMPEIGRELIHKEGVDLIRDWINSL